MAKSRAQDGNMDKVILIALRTFAPNLCKYPKLCGCTIMQMNASRITLIACLTLAPSKTT